MEQMVVNSDINLKEKLAQLIKELQMFLEQEHDICESSFINGEMTIFKQSLLTVQELKMYTIFKNQIP